MLYALGDPGVTLQLEAALALLDGEPSCPEMVTVLGKLGRSLWLSGDPDRGLEKLEEAIALAERLGLPEPVLFLGYRGGIRCIMGDVGGLDDYEKALRLASERGRMDEASLLTFNYADALLSYRGPAAAAKALTEGLDAARRRRLEALEALPARDGTISTGLLGEWDAETARRLTVNLVEALRHARGVGRGAGDRDRPAPGTGAQRGRVRPRHRAHAGSRHPRVPGRGRPRGAVPALAGAARARERDPLDLGLRAARRRRPSATAWARPKQRWAS